MAKSALAPRSNKEIAGYVRSILRYMPPARSRAQIGRDASAYALAQSKPLMDSIVADASRRIGSGTKAIGSLTTELTSRLAPIAAETGAAYDKAKADSAAQSAALGDFLHAHGAALAGELSQRTAGAGLPDDQAAALARSSAGVGDSAAGAGLGQGAVSYDRLNADAASRGALDRGLPGLAALAGIRAGRQLGAQTNFQASEAADKVRSGIPSLIGSYTTEAERENQQRGQAAVSLSQGLLGQEIQKGIARQSLGLGLEKLAVSQANTKAHVRQSDVNNRRSTGATRRGQDLTHGDRQAALKVAAQKKQDKANQATIKTARNNTQNFAIKLKTGTLGGSGQPGSLYGSGTGTAVNDPHVAFQRVSVYLGNQLGRSLELKLGQAWMRQAVNSILVAAGYPALAPARPAPAGNTTGAYGGPGGR